MRANRHVLQRKDNLYLVDCCVTGSNDGTSIDPKFSLGNAAEEVWVTLPNSKIASAYAHAYRITEEIVRMKEYNSFLDERSGLLFGVRGEFNETSLGLSRRDGGKLGAPL